MMRFLIGKIEWEDDVTFHFRGIVKRALLRVYYSAVLENIVPILLILFR